MNEKNTHKITKEEFDSLYNPEITKGSYDKIVFKINNRFSYIVNFITPIKHRKGWFDWGNGDESEQSNGYFDPNTYKIEIQVGGYFDLSEPYNEGSGEPKGWMGNSFPTRWLWEDFEEEFRQTIDKHKQKMLVIKQLEAEKKAAEKKAKKEHAAKLPQMIKIIKSKLTTEELEYVSFK